MVLGFNFKKNLFGMKLSEAANLGDALKDNCKNLVNYLFCHVILS